MRRPKCFKTSPEIKDESAQKEGRSVITISITFRPWPFCVLIVFMYTWRGSALLHAVGGESQSGSEIEGVGCKNYVSLGIILMTDIHKYLCTDNKSFGCTELRGSSEREWNTSLLVSILSRVLSKLFLGAKAIMTFHIFPPPVRTPTARRKGKSTSENNRKKSWCWVRIMYTHSCIPNVYFICEG